MLTAAPRPHPGPTAGHLATAEAILALLLPHRRTLDDGPHEPGPAACGPQLRRLLPAIAAGAPVSFTLPGFPCKSPNPAKVLGHLPDEGERLALRFLDGLCARIAAVHPPGARIVLCADGHVFGDLIGVPDAHIDAYGDALRALIRSEGLAHLRLFDLREVLGDLPYDEKRARVHARHAPTREALRARIRAGDEETRRLYQGITRFLFEDTASFAGTRSALQRDCRARAYGVIQRSRAWGALIAEQHPEAVRLSIHPQPRGAAKFGIRLLDAPDVWMTPWHACVLQHRDGRLELMRRADAERLGRLVLHQGRPSHFEAR
ncbi:L-tyrosine/L-tryptophan isonitrile synthase family protein [Streptomyces natalensis]|uniref:L-tyrosine/L-tryptophan isonitrile synthase family protein n=1 Tax=Streptomyces natalensis TaxID=68242 RepID=UPI0005CAFAD4|nr:isocyanide synthase family protein [Streptomyces natalensis]